MKKNKYEKSNNSNEGSFEKDLIELCKANRLKKTMVGILTAGTLFSAGAVKSYAQSDNNIGGFVRIPITTNAKSLKNGIEVGAYGQYVKIKDNNNVYGGEAEVFYAPFTSDIGADISGIYGDNDGFGKLGAGYSLKKGLFGKVEGQYKYFNLGLKAFLNGDINAYIGGNTGGGFDEYDKDEELSTTDGSSGGTNTGGFGDL